MHDSLTRFAGLLSVRTAMVTVVVAVVPHGTHAQTPPASFDNRPAYQSAGAGLSDLTLREGALGWPAADWHDPFADEDIDDAAALEMRMAAEDNLELA